MCVYVCTRELRLAIPRGLPAVRYQRQGCDQPHRRSGAKEDPSSQLSSERTLNTLPLESKALTCVGLSLGAAGGQGLRGFPL